MPFSRRRRERFALSESLVAERRNTRSAMKFYHLLGHLSGDITRGTVRAAKARLIVAWLPCVQYPKPRVRVRRCAVPRVTESGADRRAETFFIGITGPLHERSLSDSRFVVLRIDDDMRLMITAFPKSKTEATTALDDVIDTHIASSNFEMGMIRTDR